MLSAKFQLFSSKHPCIKQTPGSYHIWKLYHWKSWKKIWRSGGRFNFKHHCTKTNQPITKRECLEWWVESADILHLEHSLGDVTKQMFITNQMDYKLWKMVHVKWRNNENLGCEMNVTSFSSTADIVSGAYLMPSWRSSFHRSSVHHLFFKSNRFPHFLSNLSDIWVQCAQKYCQKSRGYGFWFFCFIFIFYIKF